MVAGFALRSIKMLIEMAATRSIESHHSRRGKGIAVSSGPEKALVLNFTCRSSMPNGHVAVGDDVLPSIDRSARQIGRTYGMPD